MPLPFPYHLLTTSLPFATCRELTTRCEESRFGAAAVCDTCNPYFDRTCCNQARSSVTICPLAACQIQPHRVLVCSCTRPGPRSQFVRSQLVESMPRIDDKMWGGAVLGRLLFAHNILTICLTLATWAEWTTRCEAKQFGGGCVWRTIG